MYFNTMIKLPIAVRSVEVENGTDIVDEDDINVQAASDQSSSLEKIVVTSVEWFVVPLIEVSVHGALRWSRIDAETIIFVDGSELLNHIIVVTIEHDQKSPYARWELQQSSFGEAVWFDLSIFESPHAALFLPVAAVERSEVQV